MLRLNNITKIYKAGTNEVLALDNLSLSFDKVGFVSVLGASGCGKTTLLNIVGGLDRYTDGDLIINGRSTKEYKDKDWDAYRNNSIGFVFQNYNLISHLTVLQNVELAMTLSGVASEKRHLRAKEILADVGLSDQLSKLPNQLSGGQMQRVAIARAMVNDPEILLADEPTGALDTKTSVQILELLKEISKDKLVIMVTHNAELASSYSDRIIKLSDGKLLDDTKETKDTEVHIAESDKVVECAVETTNALKPKKLKTSMSFFTALTLSFKNLLTKKMRTFITAFAGSIGIIGIALVLSLSTGLNIFIDNSKQEFMGTAVITIDRVAINYDKVTEMMDSSTSADVLPDATFPAEEEVSIYVPKISPLTFFSYNNLSADFLDYLKTNLPETSYNSYDLLKQVNFNVVKKVGDSYVGELTGMSQMASGSNFVNNNYETLKGAFSAEKYDLNLIIDENNMIEEDTLSLLGFDVSDKNAKFGFTDIIGATIKVADNNDFYKANGVFSQYNTPKYIEKDGAELADAYNNSAKTITLTVKSILRVKNAEGVSAFLSRGLYFNSSLGDELLANAAESDIVIAQKAAMSSTGQMISVLDGKLISEQPQMMGTGGDFVSDYDLTTINGDASISSVQIYPSDFNSKDTIKGIIDNWNKDKNEINKITYSDTMDFAFDMLGELTNTVTYALIAFISISLIVSTVMIGVITYVSVIERTKEIGILRSIGARKKDISRVFNAETFIIGLGAGLIGVIVAYLLIIPINIILKVLTGIANLCVLNVWSALGLIAISIFLTLIAGLIPSRIAAKKDPILALRTE